jgi:hypothetical protein
MDLIRIARRVNDKGKSKSKSKSAPKPRAKPPAKTSLRKTAPDLDVPEVMSDVLDPGVEYSFSVSLSLTVDFEGDTHEVSEDRLRKKLKAEVVAALKGAALITGNDFQLRTNRILINPVTVESAMNDQTSVGDKEGR